MPIQFRCRNCQQKLSISSKKAGAQIVCPKCQNAIRVPTLEDASEASAAAQPPALSAPASPAPAKPVPPAPEKAQPPVAQQSVEPPRARPAPESDSATVRATSGGLQKQPPVDRPHHHHEEQRTERPRDPLPLPPYQPLSPALPPFRPEPVAAAPEIDGFEQDEFEQDGSADEPADQREAVTATAHAVGASYDPWQTSHSPWKSHDPWHDGEHDEDDFHPLKPNVPPKDEIDMTSMVDVTFLLLVFFMITASFSVQKFMQITAPEADESKAAATTVVATDDLIGESVVISIDAEDRILVDDTPVAGLAELKDLLIRKLTTEQKTDVLLETAYYSTHGTCVAVTDTAIQAGMNRVRRASRRDAD